MYPHLCICFLVLLHCRIAIGVVMRLGGTVEFAPICSWYRRGCTTPCWRFHSFGCSCVVLRVLFAAPIFFWQICRMPRPPACHFSGSCYHLCLALCLPILHVHLAPQQPLPVCNFHMLLPYVRHPARHTRIRACRRPSLCAFPVEFMRALRGFLVFCVQSGCRFPATL